MKPATPVAAQQPGETGDSSGKVFAGPSAEDVARVARRKRIRRLLNALALWVGLPSILSVLYYGGIADDQFVSVASLALSPPAGDNGDYGPLFREYVLSRDMLTTLDSHSRFSDHFVQRGDPLSRLSASAGSETRYASFLHMVDISDGPISGVLRLSVRAYDGATAQRFARTVIAQGQAFLDGIAPGVRVIVVAQPSAPDESTHPHRLRGVLTTFAGALAFFVIGSLLVAAAREHADF